MTDWTVDDDDRRGEVGGREYAVQIKFVIAGRLGCRDDYGQIFGATAGHDCVCRDLLDGSWREVGRDKGNHV